MKYLLLPLLLLSQTLLAAGNTRILFGSCIHQDDPAPILHSINQEKSDLFIFLGDNIYGDTEDMDILKKKYQKQKNRPEFARLLQQTPTVAIWDDHDFGINDGGADYPQKEASRQLMLDFWQEPADSARRSRPDGIYTSYWLNHAGKNIHIILPDLRWNRPALNSVTLEQYKKDKAPENLGPYLPHTEAKKSMLGEAQWQWLEAELNKPADLIILGSSLQTLADFTGWESWANFPYDRNRLLATIADNNIRNILLISGDTHWGEFSKVALNNGYQLWDITSSGLTQEWKQVSPNRNRVGGFSSSVNYGEILVDWDQQQLTFMLRDVDGKTVMSHTLSLQQGQLSPL